MVSLAPLLQRFFRQRLSHEPHDQLLPRYLRAVPQFARQRLHKAPSTLRFEEMDAPRGVSRSHRKASCLPYLRAWPHKTLDDAHVKPIKTHCLVLRGGNVRPALPQACVPLAARAVRLPLSAPAATHPTPLCFQRDPTHSATRRSSSSRAAAKPHRVLRASSACVQIVEPEADLAASCPSGASRPHFQPLLFRVWDWYGRAMTAANDTYDVFISYSRADGRQAAEIDSFLRAKGLKSFFDRRNLAPGLPWVRGLAINAAKAVIVLIGLRGLGNTQQYERDLALIRQTRDPTFPVVPVILPETTTDRPFDFLQVLTWIDFSHVAKVSDAPDVLGQLLAAVRGVEAAAPATVGEAAPTAVAESAPAGARKAICPYPGLDASGHKAGSIRMRERTALGSRAAATSASASQ
jgi:hypothetical protein